MLLRHALAEPVLGPAFGRTRGRSRDNGDEL